MLTVATYTEPPTGTGLQYSTVLRSGSAAGGGAF
jgi:hypothetical protein